MTGTEVYEAVTADHDSFLAVLRRRASAVHVLVTTWSSGNIKAALAHLERCKDTSVAADFLSSVNLLHAAIKLEHCAKLLPHVNKLLASKFGECVAHVGRGGGHAFTADRNDGAHRVAPHDSLCLQLCVGGTQGSASAVPELLPGCRQPHVPTSPHATRWYRRQPRGPCEARVIGAH